MGEYRLCSLYPPFSLLLYPVFHCLSPSLSQSLLFPVLSPPHPFRLLRLDCFAGRQSLNHSFPPIVSMSRVYVCVWRLVCVRVCVLVCVHMAGVCVLACVLVCVRMADVWVRIADICVLVCERMADVHVCVLICARMADVYVLVYLLACLCIVAAYVLVCVPLAAPEGRLPVCVGIG